MDCLVTKREVCRLCEGKNLSMVLPIRPSPIADAYIYAKDLKHAQPLIPLDLYQCADCGHVQNLDIVNPDVLFRDYIFMTSGSQGLIKHFDVYAQHIYERFKPRQGSLVVEIGSNDGTLLKRFKDLGLVTLGVDPAEKVSQIANAHGIETINDFFNLEIAKEIKKNYGSAKLVLANNVFAHSDNISSMAEGISEILSEDGIFVFEVSYLLDIVDNYLFDTVYHEHLSYHSIGPLKKFFSRFDLSLFDIGLIGSKGGSIRGFVQRADGPYAECNIIDKMLLNEEIRKLHKPEIFTRYSSDILLRKNDLSFALKKFEASGKKVVGYGASTTATTLMYHFEINNRLEYLIDDNPKKHGMYSPGEHLLVEPSTILYGDDRPDVVVVLAWQYADIIIKKHQKYIQNGGMFLIPLPNLKIC